MKLYKEMMRKLAIVGLPLLAVTFVYTLVTGGQACFGAVYATESSSAFGLAPILNYYVFTAIIFAFYGFSFLFSRPASDVYHSLPVKRTDLFVSVLLATATWMGVTILLNILEMFAVLLISGCPFVSAYIPLTILFYFIASMLVFSAAAIGCALSGTIVTALASTGVVLLLPRFLQFLFARGVVERVPIVGWLDLGLLLDPTTNAATGILAAFLRPVFVTRLITLPHSLYSLIPLLVMLAVGWWLFRRRPSEIAQKNGGRRIWTNVTAILLSFTVMLPVTMNQQKLFSIYGAVLIAAAFAVFLVYQVIVTPKIRKVLNTLPVFLIAMFAALGFSLLLDTVADSTLNTTPTAAQIESVTFRGFDEKSGIPSYTTLLTEDIAFTDLETKQLVAQALASAVDKIKSSSESAYYYNPYEVIEPVTIQLTGGGTVKRTIEFANIDTLNALRMENETFADSVRKYPPLDSVQSHYVENYFTHEQSTAILNSYIAEAVEHGLLNGYYYRERTLDMMADGTYVMQGDNQSINGITATGYVGSDRYQDSYTVRLDTPKTVSLIMQTYNSYITEEPLKSLTGSITKFEAGETSVNDSISISITAYNYPNKQKMSVEKGNSFYLGSYTLLSTNQYDITQLDYLHQFVDLLSRTVLTDSPDGMFIRLDWYYYNATDSNNSDSLERPTSFLVFENEADQQAFITLVDSWETAQNAM